MPERPFDFVWTGLGYFAPSRLRPYLVRHFADATVAPCVEQGEADEHLQDEQDAHHSSV